MSNEDMNVVEGEAMGELKEVEQMEKGEMLNNLIFKTRCRFLVTLYPSQFMNPVRGMKQILNECILTYIHVFDGVLLCYRNVKSVTVAVPHIDSVPYSYFAGEADLYIFKPIIGTNIVAEIASTELDHGIATVLVKGCFNGDVMVKKEILKTLSPGQYIRFKLTSTHYKKSNYIMSGEFVEVVEAEEEGGEGEGEVDGERENEEEREE